MQLDYVDLLFCHRPDTTTPIEETVRAMNYIIDHGWAFYWCALLKCPLSWENPASCWFVAFQGRAKSQVCAK